MEETEHEFELLELRLEDGGDPDAIHHFLLECFTDESGFVAWSLEELNAMLAQCARKATCAAVPDDDEDADEDALDLVAQMEDEHG